MQSIRNPADAASIAELELRALVQKTIRALREDYPYDPDALGKIIIIQPGDTIATINAQVGFDILYNRWTGLRYDHAGYTPAFEILEEYASCFDLLFIVDDRSSSSPTASCCALLT
jgi:hypothetical protein